MDKVIVIVATRNESNGRGTVGYFKTLADVPPEFTYPGEQDISGVMKSFRTTDLDHCLKLMNSHWRKS